MKPFHRTLAIVVMGAVLAPGAVARQVDPARAIKSKDVQERLDAVEALRDKGGDKHEKLLLRALADKDWEVSERAAWALAERGGAASLEPLLKLALEGPTRRARRAAARALAAIDARTAAIALAKRLGKKDGLRACEAIAIVAPFDGSAAAGKAMIEVLGKGEDASRAAAARGLAGLAAEDRGEWLKRLLADDDFVVRAAALAGVVEHPGAFGLPVLLGAYEADELPDVIERRLARAVVAWVAHQGASSPADALADLAPWMKKNAAGDSERAARCMRLSRSLAALDTVAPLGELARRTLEAGLAHGDERVRAAALHAGAAYDAILDAALVLAREDSSAGVRQLALRSLAAARDVASDSEVRELAIEQLTQDRAARVRQEAAVALGVRGLRPTEALVSGLEDLEWTVAACSAVSLGLTRDLDAIDALVAMGSHEDWRLRGAAAVGLTHMNHARAVPALIRCLADSEPAVRTTAYEYLSAVARVEVEADEDDWRKWWAESSGEVRFPEPEDLRKQRERYGYAQRDEEVFKGLDVVVLESRGDHIEQVLERLKIVHRRTQAARIAEAGLHPGAVYVSNCTGEVEPDDVERLEWFVLTGGYLFGSCWSLSQTIEKVYPGIVRWHQTGGDVLDDVTAEAVEADSPYLSGVFGEGVSPIYHLEGAHLIEVLEPTLCEVLIDSVEALENWGSGNLAVWFRAGHGLILDSVNHFDLQGLERAPGVKTDAERMAFAIDHLGLDYASWRATQKERWWGNAFKAAQNVFDLSAFRFVTNFVREKRLSDG